MGTLTVVLSFGSVLTGLCAAWKWYKASRHKFVPFVEVNGEPVQVPDTDVKAWLNALKLTVERAGSNNASAAIWTAISIGLAALSTLTQLF